MRFNAEKGKSILVLVTVVGVLSLLLSILGEKVIGLIVNRNNAAAAATLKTIATGLENYGKEHGGEYPDNFAVLTKGQPPYIDRDYLAGSPHNGFNYFCSRLDKTGYNCSAIPLKCGISGSKNYAVATGNLFVSEDCDKNE
ncbi:MAG: hypothetical protein WBE75_00240 [Candidatus Omnitrophota bacterium]